MSTGKSTFEPAFLGGPLRSKLIPIACIAFISFAVGGAACASLGLGLPSSEREADYLLQDAAVSQDGFIKLLDLGEQERGSGRVANATLPGAVARPESKVVAVVNQERIYYADVRILVEPSLAEAAKIFRGSWLAAKSSELWKAALDGLIDRKLLLQEARRMNLTVDDPAAKAYLQAQIAASGSLEALYASLPMENPYALVHTKGKKEVAALEVYFKEELAIDLLLERRVGSQTPWAQFSDSDNIVWVGPGEIRSYYEQNPGEFTEPETVCFRQCVFRAQEDAGDALSKARDVLRRIAEGEPFERVAQEISEGPHASDGGLWKGEVTYDQLQTPIATALKGLSVGQVSEVIEVDYGGGEKGYHVVKLDACTKSRMEPFQTAQRKIRQVLIAGKRGEATFRLMQELRDKASIKVIPLAEAPLYVREQ